MYERLTDPAAIDSANRYFNDLIALADPAEQLPFLRPQVEDFRFEVLNHNGMLSIQNQLRGFLWGLLVAGVLTPEQGRDLSQRLEVGRQTGWL
ncbi:hypothetical protein PspCFBP13509_11530 [Pseudomonas sp. CFBP13509]|uniref:hypothetical protein n=1 Tax=Pseudomonas sp. CFBP13509 TaxID=2184008 RepID=UPI0010C06BFB|nr:hypothetical protein [Pseudomonas sp. CFBP13509]TKJ79340.1 hypothetical protein PspCFBP13509_11530 [Pseudomonas sp. CFBP13509]